MRNIVAAGAAVGTLVLIAGCGSSSKSKTTEASTSPAAPAAASSTTGTSGGSAYGSSSGSSSSSGSTASGVVVSVKHGKLGSILSAGPRHMTVYVFDADKGSSSSCSGACAAKWPPLTTSGTPRAGSGAQASALGTITRSDGTKQVTYAGHPLYYFVKDKDDGDAYGQGVNAFGASWYAVKPTGEKLDNS